MAAPCVCFLLFHSPRATASATRMPSTAALTMPPAYPAPISRKAKPSGSPWRFQMLGRSKFALRHGPGRPLLACGQFTLRFCLWQNTCSALCAAPPCGAPGEGAFFTPGPPLLPPGCRLRRHSRSHRRIQPPRRRGTIPAGRTDSSHPGGSALVRTTGSLPR